METIIKELQDLEEKYGKCDHLHYPDKTPAPEHCLEDLKKILKREIKSHRDYWEEKHKPSIDSPKDFSYNSKPRIENL